MNRTNVISCLSLSLTLLLGAIAPTHVVADQPTTKKKTVPNQRRTKHQSDDKRREILSRQKSDAIKVYLKDSSGVYVNGKSVSAKELAAIVRKSELKQAVITGSIGVSEKRYEEVRKWIQQAGIKRVQINSQRVPTKKIATETTKAETRSSKEKLRTIIDRQRGDQLAVHLNQTGLYVNGKSLSQDKLETLIKTLKPAKAIVSVDAEVSPEKLKEVRTTVQATGVKKVGFKVLKRKK